MKHCLDAVSRPDEWGQTVAACECGARFKGDTSTDALQRLAVHVGCNPMQSNCRGYEQAIASGVARRLRPIV